MTEGAYILVEVLPGRRKQILNEVRALEGVVSVHTVTGPYDIIVYVEGPGLRDLERVFSAIKAIEGVSRITTCLTFEG